MKNLHRNLQVKTAALLIFIFFTSTVFSQSLYIKSFGENKSNAVIFLHGGPGYNSASFEATTAQKLADENFFVIVYDRRGEGRSDDANAKFTFEETFTDLNNIYEQFGITSAGLIGHSFGGVVGTLFAEKYPEKVTSLILVSGPVSLQETFQHIISSTRKIYEEKNNTEGLKTIDLLERMDKTSMQFASMCFMEAMKNGAYGTKNPTPDSKKIREDFVNDSLFHYSLKMTIPAPLGFSRNENYTSINLTSNINNLITKKAKVYGLYGMDDGLYSAEQVAQLQTLIGENNVQYLSNCSHSVFIDRQPEFIAALKNWIK